jgi:hypothetical protein
MLACRSDPAAPTEAGAEPHPQTDPPAERAWMPPRVVVSPTAGDDAAPGVAIEVPTPAFAPGSGPRVVIDAGHHNFEIRANYAVFAEALRDDGFVVEFADAAISAESLAGVELLVIVNPLHPSNVDSWSLPTPSAFTNAEIEAIASFVEAGGGLWLVADHHPFPGAVGPLAARFGFTLHNGFAFRSPNPGEVVQDLIGFRRSDETILGGHPITDGAQPGEQIEQLLSFTGEAFEPPPEARALFVLPDDGLLLLPETAWQFDEDTPRVAAGGFAVAAVREQGRGKVAMFGEAAMLSARFVNSNGEWFGVGFVHPDARDNLQLVLNTARWLTG